MYIEKSAKKIFTDCIYKCSNARARVASGVIIFYRELRDYCPITIRNIRDAVLKEFKIEKTQR